MNSFFNCISEILKEELPIKINSDCKLKMALDQTDYEEDIDINNMANVELLFDKYKLKLYKIIIQNSEGIILYKSTTRKAPHIIRLLYSNSKYTIIKVKRTKGTALSAKQPIIYCFPKKFTDDIVCYGIDGEFKMKRDEFNEIKSNPITSKYILIAIDRDGTLKETYDMFMTDAIELKKQTNGIIDMLKTGSDHNTCMDLFNRLNKCEIPEPIQPDEADWINYATCGALVDGTKYDGPAYKYDIVSMYPSIMRSNKFLLPIKRGIFSNISEKEELQIKFYSVGIYHCIIDVKNNKLMRTNKTNHYTHTDINYAISLGYKVSLIHDGNNNALIYKNSDCLMGSHIFGEFVDLLFPLKKAGNKRAKRIINTLWGALSEQDKLTICTNKNTITEIYDNRQVMTLCPDDNGETVIQFTKNEKRFKTDYARIKPFLLSRGRYVISKIFLSQVDDLVRAHTDGIIMRNPINFKLGIELGDLRYEGYSGHIEILNKTRYIEHVKFDITQ